MDLISILVSLLRAGWPLPDLNNEEATAGWITRLAPTLAAIIARIAPDAPSLPAAWTDDAAIVAAVQAEVPEANGEKIKALLAFLMQILPYILPLLLKPAPAPLPGPVT